MCIALMLIIMGVLALFFLSANYIFAKPTTVFVALALPIASIFYIYSASGSDLSVLDWLISSYPGMALESPGYALAITFSVLLIPITVYSIRENTAVQNRNIFLYCISASLLAVSSDFSRETVIFWEFTCISTLMILHNTNGNNLRSFMHYACAHFVSGSCILAFVAIRDINGMSINSLLDIALIINCALLPFSAVMVEPYSSVNAQQTLVLQAFSTKVHLLLLSIAMTGDPILVVLGVATCLYAMGFLFLEDRIMKFLLYNTAGQAGLIAFLIGAGYQNIAPQIIASLVYQTALYMCACSIIKTTERYKFSEISGVGMKMPITLILAIIVCLSMAAFPATPGFFGKLAMKQPETAHPIILGILSYGLWALTSLKFINCIFGGRKEQSLYIRKQTKSEITGIIIIGFMSLFPLFIPYDLSDKIADNWASYCIYPTISLLFFIVLKPFIRLQKTIDLEKIYMDAVTYIGNSGTKTSQNLLLFVKTSFLSLTDRLRNYEEHCRMIALKIEEVDSACYFVFLIFLLVFLVSLNV